MINFGNLRASELIPPAPFSPMNREEGGALILNVFSPLLFLREGAGGGVQISALPILIVKFH